MDTIDELVSVHFYRERNLLLSYIGKQNKKITACSLSFRGLQNYKCNNV